MLDKTGAFVTIHLPGPPRGKGRPRFGRRGEFVAVPVATAAVARLDGGAAPLALLAGPCVLESRDHAFMMCEQLKKISERAGVSLIYKSSYDKANRTSIKAERGLGLVEAVLQHHRQAAVGRRRRAGHRRSRSRSDCVPCRGVGGHVRSPVADGSGSGCCGQR